MAAPTDARELLVKSKLYRTFSLIFVTIGIFLFCYLYVSNVNGRMMEALRDPLTILIFLIPFLPAAALTWVADRYEKKYLQAVSSSK